MSVGFGERNQHSLTAGPPKPTLTHRRPAARGHPADGLWRRRLLRHRREAPGRAHRRDRLGFAGGPAGGAADLPRPRRQCPRGHPRRLGRLPRPPRGARRRAPGRRRRPRGVRREEAPCGPHRRAARTGSRRPARPSPTRSSCRPSTACSSRPRTSATRRSASERRQHGQHPAVGVGGGLEPELAEQGRARRLHRAFADAELGGHAGVRAALGQQRQRLELARRQHTRGRYRPVRGTSAAPRSSGRARTRPRSPGAARRRAPRCRRPAPSGGSRGRPAGRRATARRTEVRGTGSAPPQPFRGTPSGSGARPPAPRRCASAASGCRRSPRRAARAPPAAGGPRRRPPRRPPRPRRRRAVGTAPIARSSRRPRSRPARDHRLEVEAPAALDQCQVPPRAPHPVGGRQQTVLLDGRLRPVTPTRTHRVSAISETHRRRPRTAVLGGPEHVGDRDVRRPGSAAGTPGPVVHLGPEPHGGLAHELPHGRGEPLVREHGGHVPCARRAGSPGPRAPRPPPGPAAPPIAGSDSVRAAGGERQHRPAVVGRRRGGRVRSVPLRVGHARPRGAGRPGPRPGDRRVAAESRALRSARRGGGRRERSSTRRPVHPVAR